MITIIYYLISAIIGGIIGIFIYRNNTDLISKKADEVDKVWDRLGLTEKFDELGEKIESIKKK